MTRWWSYGAEARLSFRTEITRPRPADLTERVRTLDACLREAQPGHLTADEEAALESLLQAVQHLTEPSLSGRG